MSAHDLEAVLVRLHACEPALSWARTSGCSTFAEAWAACPRGSWLAWLVLACNVPGGRAALWDVVQVHCAQYAGMDGRPPSEALRHAEEDTPRRYRAEVRQSLADYVRMRVSADDVERALRSV